MWCQCLLLVRLSVILLWQYQTFTVFQGPCLPSALWDDSRVACLCQMWVFRALRGGRLVRPAYSWNHKAPSETIVSGYKHADINLMFQLRLLMQMFLRKKQRCTQSNSCYKYRPQSISAISTDWRQMRPLMKCSVFLLSTKKQQWKEEEPQLGN